MDVHVARTSPYADSLLAVTNELDEVFSALHKQGGFDMEAIHAVILSADSEEWRVQAKWAGWGDAEIT